MPKPKADQKLAIIFGAGPAGLTAAYELVHRTDIKPIVFELSDTVGGISKTITYKGNRIDIGGHRFYSKSDRVMQWWQDILPLQGAPARDDIILERRVPLSPLTDAPDPDKTDRVLLVRNRLSSIYFSRRFFPYPVSLSFQTLRSLGFARSGKIIFDYLKARCFPIRNENNLEDFFVNRFGRKLYSIFFREYTEKIWGASCKEISKEWGVQRVKGVSLTKVLLNAFKTPFAGNSGIEQKEKETSFIDTFIYPKLGPGQMWEEVARKISERGGQVLLGHRIVGLKAENHRICEVTVKNRKTGELWCQKGDYFFSSMPVKDLILALEDSVSREIREVAEGLKYRASIVVGLLLRKLKIPNKTGIRTVNNIPPDNWIYIQDREVKVGRLQIYNNWSPYLVRDPNTAWIGLEYFCDEEGEFWNQPDQEIKDVSARELTVIEIIDSQDILDSVVIRVPKTYPAYLGSYPQFGLIRNFLDEFENLFLIGRNGMHRYNNMDHSMLTAIAAVDNIVNQVRTKENIWAVNAEPEYVEVDH